MHMELNRRKFVASTAAVLSAAGLGTTVIAEESVPVEIADVFPEAEVVILENTGEEAVDLGGHVLDWEHNGETNQTDSFDDGVTIEAGETLSVWTGYPSDGDVEADVQIGEYDNGRLNNEEPDVVALLTPDEEVVDEAEATNDGQSYEEFLGDGDENGGDENGGDENGGDENGGDENGGDENGGDGDESGGDENGDGDENGGDENGGDDTSGDDADTGGDADADTGGDDESAGAGDEDCPEDEADSAQPAEDECPEEEPQPAEEECPEAEPEPEPEEDC